MQESSFSNWSHRAVDFILGKLIQTPELQTYYLYFEMSFLLLEGYFALMKQTCAFVPNC